MHIYIPCIGVKGSHTTTYKSVVTCIHLIVMTLQLANCNDPTTNCNDPTTTNCNDPTTNCNDPTTTNCNDPTTTNCNDPTTNCNDHTTNCNEVLGTYVRTANDTTKIIAVMPQEA